MFKIFILIIFAVILWSLGSALFQMSKSRGDSTKMVRALTIRISLSLALFLFILLAWFLGWIEPHGLTVIPAGE